MNNKILEIGEDKSLLSQFIGKEALKDANPIAPVSEVTGGNNNQNPIEEVIEQNSLLFKVISEDKSKDASNYKTQYDENVSSGKWKEVEDADKIVWNEESFKKIETAQIADSSKRDDEEDKAKNATPNPIVSSNEEITFRQGRIEALNKTDFNDIENAKELYQVYREQQDGAEQANAIKKQIEALNDDEIITYAKTISAKIVKDDELFIKTEHDKETAKSKADEDNWNKYADSVVESGTKLKVTAAQSKEKLEKVKNGEFNKQFWAIMADPEKFHKAFDFLMDMEKYENKIKTKANSKLVVEAITEKNINTVVSPQTNYDKINIPI